MLTVYVVMADTSITMPPIGSPKRSSTMEEMSKVHSDPELAAQQQRLLGSENDHGEHVDTSADVGRMLDAVSNSSKFSFKEGFYSESEADLGRHRRDLEDVEGRRTWNDYTICNSV